jgi:predicted HTH transcriptional regulator
MTISAAKIIAEFVEHEKIPTSSELGRILTELGRADSRVEYDRLDFKREFDKSTNAWLDLIKHTVAMANIGGGVIIFGVSDGWRPYYRHLIRRRSQQKSRSIHAEHKFVSHIRR